MIIANGLNTKGIIIALAAIDIRATPLNRSPSFPVLRRMQGYAPDGRIVLSDMTHTRTLRQVVLRSS
jgi:hypothetical protein